MSDADAWVADPFDATVLASVASVTGEDSSSSQDDRTSKGSKESTATRLVNLALSSYEMRLADDGTVFAVPLSGERVTFPLRGGRQSLRAVLARAYFDEHGGAAPQQSLADALLVLEGHGQSRDPEPLHLRVAPGNGPHTVWLDMGDATGRAVKIDPSAWTRDDTFGVPLFRRTALTSPLPEPDPTGTLDALWELLNVDPADRPLVLAWLVSTLLPNVPHPIPGLFGEQGTGKTFTAKVVSLLVDPSPVPVRKAPRDADSWVTAASGSWVVALDNLSTVPDWLSDTLCRAVTGDGDVRRQLYTDGGLVVFAFRRCVLVTGIDLGAVRGDLADRLLPIDLRVIEDDQRLDEADLWGRWERLHPYLLGGLLNLTASVMAVLPSVRLESRPRMADFARVLAAVDQITGSHGLDRYRDRAGTLAIDSLTADAFVAAIRDVAVEPFEGTSAELLEHVTSHVVAADEKWRAPKEWPANARQVTTLLKRQAPVMRRAGWTAVELLPGRDHAIRWRIGRPEKVRNQDSQHSRHSQPRSESPPPASVSTQSASDRAPSHSQDTRSQDHDSRSSASVASVESRPSQGRWDALFDDCCGHGMPAGDQPDAFTNGRLRCPQCAVEAAS